jgi:hypothetical protein
MLPRDVRALFLAFRSKCRNSEIHGSAALLCVCMWVRVYVCGVLFRSVFALLECVCVCLLACAIVYVNMPLLTYVDACMRAFEVKHHFLCGCLCVPVSVHTYIYIYIYIYI